MKETNYANARRKFAQLLLDEYDTPMQEAWETTYELMLANREVHLMSEGMIEGWFSESVPAYNDFIKAMLCDDVKWMNAFLSRFCPGAHGRSG